MSTDHPLSVVSMYFGIPEDELEWTWKRLKYLIQERRMRPNQASKLVEREARDKPWRKIIILE